MQHGERTRQLLSNLTQGHAMFRNREIFLQELRDRRRAGQRICHLVRHPLEDRVHRAQSTPALQLRVRARRESGKHGTGRVEDRRQLPILEQPRTLNGVADQQRADHPSVRAQREDHDAREWVNTRLAADCGLRCQLRRPSPRRANFSENVQRQTVPITHCDRRRHRADQWAQRIEERGRALTSAFSSEKDAEEG